MQLTTETLEKIFKILNKKPADWKPRSFHIGTEEYITMPATARMVLGFGSAFTNVAQELGNMGISSSEDGEIKATIPTILINMMSIDGFKDVLFYIIKPVDQVKWKDTQKNKIAFKKSLTGLEDVPIDTITEVFLDFFYNNDTLRTILLLNSETLTVAVNKIPKMITDIIQILHSKICFTLAQTTTSSKQKE